MNLSEIAIAIGVVAAVTAVLTVVAGRKIKSSWTGCLEEKKINSTDGVDSDTASATIYTLVFRTDAGNRVSMKVTKALFEEFSRGDRAEKAGRALSGENPLTGAASQAVTRKTWGMRPLSRM